jgi:hypothetical protein
MSQVVFVGDVDGRAIRDGKDLYAAASEDIQPGLLCVVTAGSSVALADADDAPWGVAYGARHQVYRPTSKTFADGEELVLLKGDFVSYYSAAFFVGETLPSQDDTLYSASSGSMDTSGTNKVGKCTRLFTRTEEIGGVGTSQNLAEVLFEVGKP